MQPNIVQIDKALGSGGEIFHVTGNASIESLPTKGGKCNVVKTAVSYRTVRYGDIKYSLLPLPAFSEDLCGPKVLLKLYSIK